jgi:hypothetical protein
MASSIPLPQTPPINLPPALQLQPQAAVSTPSTHLEIPGAYPHETSWLTPRHNTSETSRGQSYFPTKPASYLCTSFPIIEKNKHYVIHVNCELSRRKEDLVTVDGERGR